MKDIVETRPLEGYQLYLRFEDGVEGVVDISQHIAFAGVFEPLRDRTYFEQVRVDADAEQSVCRELQVPAYPTLLFLSPRGVPLERVVGKRAGHEVLMAMQAALQHVARRNSSSDIQRQ